MRFVDKQARLEKRTYEAIDELEDVFGVEVRDYPEVRWMGSKGHFEDLGLPEYYRDVVENNKKNHGSLFLYKPGIVILNKDDIHHINEESSHYVHMSTSGIVPEKRNREDMLALNCLIEMFGFLGSKILNPTRGNWYKQFPDYFSIGLKHGLNFEKLVDLLDDFMTGDTSDRLIHSQGWCLGERVFYALQIGQIKMDYVQELFRKNFLNMGKLRILSWNYVKEFGLLNFSIIILKKDNFIYFLWQ